LSFLNHFTGDNQPYIKRVRNLHLWSSFNLVRYNINPGFTDPCDTPMTRRLFFFGIFRDRIFGKWKGGQSYNAHEIIPFYRECVHVMKGPCLAKPA